MTCPKCGSRRIATVWRGDYQIDRCLDCDTAITRRVPRHHPVGERLHPWAAKLAAIDAELSVVRQERQWLDYLARCAAQDNALMDQIEAA